MTIPAELCRAALSRYPRAVAIVDDDGEIVFTNDEWVNDPLPTTREGQPTALTEADLRTTAVEDPERAEVALRALLTGDREAVELEYPAPAPESRRWHGLEAHWFTYEESRYAILAQFDITDRKHVERTVREKNRRLESIASIISHELRSPRNVALGRLSLLEGEVSADAIESIRSALDRMTAMAEDALVLARRLSTSDVHPVDLESVVGQASAPTETAEASVDVTGSLRLQADPGVLQELLENLFRNAVEHAGPTVTIRIVPLDDGFAVEDAGPGIPKARREEVFEAGVTTGSPADHTGLGLLIVEEIATAHGWEVELGDSADGGARFEFHGVEPSR